VVGAASCLARIDLEQVPAHSQRAQRHLAMLVQKVREVARCCSGAKSMILLYSEDLYH
jgi:hypothetical protein